MSTVAEATGGQGIWVRDWGGDREVVLKQWAQEPLRDIGRWGGARLGEGEEESGGLERKRLRPGAATGSLKGWLPIRPRDRRGRWHPVILRYGHGGFPWQGAPSWLVVVQGWEQEPLGRWTNIPALTLALAEFLLRCSLRRWRVEDASRGLKQGFQLEALRGMRWVTLRKAKSIFTSPPLPSAPR